MESFIKKATLCPTCMINWCLPSWASFFSCDFSIFMLDDIYNVFSGFTQSAESFVCCIFLSVIHYMCWIWLKLRLCTLIIVFFWISKKKEQEESGSICIIIYISDDSYCVTAGLVNTSACAVVCRSHVRSWEYMIYWLTTILFVHTHLCYEVNKSITQGKITGLQSLSSNQT